MFFTYSTPLLLPQIILNHLFYFRIIGQFTSSWLPKRTEPCPSRRPWSGAPHPRPSRRAARNLPNWTEGTSRQLTSRCEWHLWPVPQNFLPYKQSFLYNGTILMDAFSVWHMLVWRVAQLFSKIATYVGMKSSPIIFKNSHICVLFIKVTFLIEPKTLPKPCVAFVRKFADKTFKNSPIWSHWFLHIF